MQMENRFSCHSSPHPLPAPSVQRALTGSREHTASVFRHSPPTAPGVASHRFLGAANAVWTPAKTGDVFWVTLCKHIYTLCLWALQVHIMIHYTQSILNIEAWKILSSGESLGVGQYAEGEDNKNLFLEFYSVRSEILMLVKKFLRVFHKLHMVGEGENEDGGRTVTKCIHCDHMEDFPLLRGVHTGSSTRKYLLPIGSQMSLLCVWRKDSVLRQLLLSP